MTVVRFAASATGVFAQRTGPRSRRGSSKKSSRSRLVGSEWWGGRGPFCLCLRFEAVAVAAERTAVVGGVAAALSDGCYVVRFQVARVAAALAAVAGVGQHGSPEAALCPTRPALLAVAVG